MKNYIVYYREKNDFQDEVKTASIAALTIPSACSKFDQMYPGRFLINIETENKDEN